MEPFSKRITMIQSFKHKGLEAFAEAGRITGIRPGHAKRLRELLRELSSVKHIGSLSKSAGLHRIYFYKGRCCPATSAYPRNGVFCFNGIRRRG